MDGTEPDPTHDGSGARRLVLNPTSGRGDHAEEARRLATEHGFQVVATERRGHAADLAAEAAADGVDLLGVCGGDGTLHEVVQGLVGVDALDSVTLSVVPAGTENFVAGDLGIEDIGEGFEVAERGETRRLDLGLADGEPFVLSAIAGLPADVSAAATHDLKRRFGPFAFVVAAVSEGLAFDGIHVEVDAVSEDAVVEWVGEALTVLVGNLRQFARPGGQADAEDGTLRVAIVEEMPPRDLVAEAVEQRLLHRETQHVTELTATRLRIAGLDDQSVTFSLDGEIREFETAHLTVSPQALRIRVGESYDPASSTRD